MHIPLLTDVTIILGLSVIIVLLFQRLKLPSILGFLITGVLAGPYGLKLIKSTHGVELLSEIGIIFLLFVIGIEFSLKTLSAIKRTVFIGGLLQVGGTIGIVTLICNMFGMPITESIFLGFLISLSSTAIVLKILQEKGEIAAPHSKVSVAILIFQDIIVVPMMLVVPLMAGASNNIGASLFMLIIKVTVIIGIMFILARYIVPLLFKLVVKTKNRELFILTVVVICFSTAWLTASTGLSLALGAFFAGLIISESDYSHQATANILPFKEIFISFFFVSVGMLLNLNFFIENFLTINLLTLLVIIIKTIVVIIAVFILKYQARTIFITAFTIFQVGEFSFLLSVTGMQYNLLTTETYQYFLSISILSMGITPYIMSKASEISSFILRAPLPKKVRQRLNKINLKKSSKIIGDNFSDHLVIIGYGINGKNLSKAAKKANIPYVIIELEPGIINQLKRENEPFVFGDASEETILHHVNIHKARVIVVAISDKMITAKIVSTIREVSETTYIIVRSRDIENIDENFKMGADEVIPEEFETSIIIFTSVLKKYLVPNHEIQNFTNLIRSENYELLRNIPINNTPKLSIPDMTIATISVMQENNKIVGKTISESNLRADHGVNILAIKRGNKYISEITPQTRILQNDILYIFGKPENINKVSIFLVL